MEQQHDPVSKLTNEQYELDETEMKILDKIIEEREQDPDKPKTTNEWLDKPFNTDERPYSEQQFNAKKKDIDEDMYDYHRQFPGDVFGLNPDGSIDQDFNNRLTHESLTRKLN